MSSKLDFLRPYAPIVVDIQGEVAFSHITKMYEGDELIAANKRTQEHGGRPSSRPYCMITIDNPRILHPETLPADVVSIMQERFKPSKTTNVIKYYATSKSRTLPPVAYSIYAGAGLAGQGIADRTHPLAYELDTGLRVTIGARIFDTTAGVGVGIEYVLIDEPVRYYESNPLAGMFAGQGVSYTAPSSDVVQNPPAPRPAAGSYAGTHSDSRQPGGKMPYDPAFYYTENTKPASTAFTQNTTPQSSGYFNGAYQNAGNTGTVNRTNTESDVYNEAMQLLENMNRNANAQMSQLPATPRVRMGMPGQSQNRIA